MNIRTKKANFLDLDNTSANKGMWSFSVYFPKKQHIISSSNIYSKNMSSALKANFLAIAKRPKQQSPLHYNTTQIANSKKNAKINSQETFSTLLNVFSKFTQPVKIFLTKQLKNVRRSALVVLFLDVVLMLLKKIYIQSEVFPSIFYHW